MSESKAAADGEVGNAADGLLDDGKPGLAARFLAFQAEELAGADAAAKAAAWLAFRHGVLQERAIIAGEWGGLIHEGTSGDVDIGECIRDDGRRDDDGVLKR